MLPRGQFNRSAAPPSVAQPFPRAVTRRASARALASPLQTVCYADSQRVCIRERDVVCVDHPSLGENRLCVEELASFVRGPRLRVGPTWTSWGIAKRKTA